MHRLFVPPGETYGIAIALSRVANDPALRIRLVDNGRQLYEKHFAIDGYMRRMLALYDALLEQRLASRSADFEQ